MAEDRPGTGGRSGEKVLVVLVNGRTVGRLGQDTHGQLSFTYDDSWRELNGATPLSLSMPLSERRHGNRTVDPFLRGLLPDSENVLQRWGRRFSVSANSPFGLLSYVGEDVAGAAQFVLPERIVETTQPGHIEPVDEDYLGKRLRVLRGDRAAWDDAAAPGQFSLAGAQAKFALYRSRDGQWGLPSGRKATTHILKPPLEHLAHQEVNEHLCLRAAKRLGMRTADSSVMSFGGEHAVVLQRYDRIVDSTGDVRRIHQEDICQALSVQPARKYEREDGGPGVLAILALLDKHQPKHLWNTSAEQFIKALAYNWVICGPDAHAKNYSLLLEGGQVGLAPFYDISSVLPYPDRYPTRTMATAMSINGKYQNNLVTGEDWAVLAKGAGLESEQVLTWVHQVVDNAPDAMSDTVAEQERWIRDLTMSASLINGLAESAQKLSRLLDVGTTRPTAHSEFDFTAVAEAPQRKEYVRSYQRADGTWVKGYRNPKHPA